MAHIEDRLDRLEAAQAALSRSFSNLCRTQADEQPRATYVSGSSTTVYDIETMPTRYIVNVLNMDSERQARGLVAALKRELHLRSGKTR